MSMRTWAAVATPETFTERTPTWATAVTLATGASLGIGLYGGAIHLGYGPLSAASGALRAVVCAGAAWTLAIPALVVLSALTRSTVPWCQAVHASLVTVNFGGMAFLASIPVVFLLQVTSPVEWTHALVNVLVLLGVGGCSTLVFERSMAQLEGRRFLHRLWMLTFGVLFLEFAWLADLFRFV